MMAIFVWTAGDVVGLVFFVGLILCFVVGLLWILAREAWTGLVGKWRKWRGGVSS